MSTAAVGSSILSDLGLALKQQDVEKQELGQADFLKLMTTQLQYQDPFKPMESGEFLGQIAQFSTVSGIQSMQESIETLAGSLSANQTLQATNLVGHGVLVPSDSGYLFGEGGVAGSATLPSSGTLTIEISDASGQVVRRIDLGEQSAGKVDFVWDGLDTAGVRLAEGAYGIKAQLTQGSTRESLATSVVGLVDSVSIGASGLSLNLFGMSAVGLGQVQQIL